MADYLKVWKTKEVTVGTQIVGANLIIERIRGSKQKRKRIILECDSFPSLVQAVVHATTMQPVRQLQAQVPVGMVDGGCTTLTVEWAPYYFGTCNALMIRGGRGHCVAVEQKNILSFAIWLTQQISVVREFTKHNLA